MKCDAHGDLPSRFEHAKDLCEVCGRMSRRFVTKLPQVEAGNKPSRDAECDLLGGEVLGDSQRDDGDSSVSEDLDVDSEDLAEARHSDDSRPMPSHDAGRWKVKIGRQGMSCAGWKSCWK